MFHMISETS